MPASRRGVVYPGNAVAEREGLELTLHSETMGEVRRFLLGVERDAAGALSSPVVLAAGSDPFSLGQVTRRWGRVVDRMTRSLAAWLETPPQDPFVAAQVARLRESPLPGKVYTDTRDALVTAVQGEWDRERTVQALAEKLEPVQWAPMARRIARTEATAAFNHSSLQRLAREGFTRKRWVAHHDARTRVSHAKADGQTVVLDAEFVVGGYALMVPADPSAPIEETASCRCVIVGAP